MSNQDQIVIKHYIKNLSKVPITIDSIYLFGSRAKGTTRRWSDYDFCVVSPNFGINKVDETTTLLMAARDIKENIEPHPMTPIEFNDPNNDFANEIKRTGIKIA